MRERPGCCEALAVELAHEAVRRAGSFRKKVVHLDGHALFAQCGSQASRSGVVPFPEGGRENQPGLQSHFFLLKKMSIPATVRRHTAQKNAYPNGQLSSGMFQGCSVLKFIP